MAAPDGEDRLAILGDDPSSDPVRWRVLFVLLVAIFMSLISVSIVNVALPAIQHGLGATQSDLQ